MFYYKNVKNHIKDDKTNWVLAIYPRLKKCDYLLCVLALSDHQGVVSMLCRRAEDEKSGVRKAAIIALQSVLLLDASFCNQKVIHS